MAQFVPTVEPAGAVPSHRSGPAVVVDPVDALAAAAAAAAAASAAAVPRFHFRLECAAFAAAAAACSAGTVHALAVD